MFSKKSTGAKKSKPVKNLPSTYKKSKTGKYALTSQNRLLLYSKPTSPALVPAKMFSHFTNTYADYSEHWKSNGGNKQLGIYKTDCGKYARLLRSKTTKKEKDKVIKDSKQAKTKPQVGDTYYISPRTKTQPTFSALTSGWAVEDPVSDLNAKIKKHATNFHVATVVANDGSTIITSEVNAAFQNNTTPWFSMYEGGMGFYKTFRLEYSNLAKDKKSGKWKVTQPPIIQRQSIK
ncbi:hypothetical protein L1077_15615 [Pseudoalteromonas luteoviolacea]|uniref:hypothetical protein n=1 Tax=Pseudoalteromonas luteoviolacea TaxID=43657 RepID=UPI001F237A1C|nr:hypothetical protein [Pseudoalteromonas luteoviolacea]MCF6440865.1 hypothetical protein [Pseudoalteromonas luteoviolacea]